MIKLTRNPPGWYRQWLFGFAYLADGLVLITSFGALSSNFTMTLARQQGRRTIEKSERKNIKEHRRVLDRDSMPRLK